MRKALFIVTLVHSISSLRVGAQTAEWNAHLHSFFDNAELGGSIYRTPLTMAGVRPGLGFGLVFDTLHALKAGGSLLQEFGDYGALQPSLIAYYAFKGNSFHFAFGAFPRELALKGYPRPFFQDSVAYYRPTIQGLNWGYTRQRLEMNLWLDWTGRQTADLRETFFMGFSGEFHWQRLKFRCFSYMYHFAGRATPQIDDGSLHDNGMVLFTAGLDLADILPLNRLEMHAGVLLGIEDERDITPWLVNSGFYGEVKAAHRGFSLHHTLYGGQGQMTFYADHGGELYWGDPFYRAPLYQRSDLTVTFFDRDQVKLRFVYSMHFTGTAIYHQQGISLAMRLSGEVR